MLNLRNSSFIISRIYKLILKLAMDVALFSRISLLIVSKTSLHRMLEKEIPFIYGAIFQFSGQMSVFDTKKGPCFQCVFSQLPTPEISASNRGIGVIGALPGVIGSLQAIEAIKIVTGIGNSMVGRLLLFDGLEMTFREVNAIKVSDCPICSK